MELKEAVRHIGGKLLYETEEILQRQYSYAVASDLMSNVMLDTADDSMLITSLVNPQVIRASEMMNITCIIITCGKQVTDAMIELARNRNIALVETKGTTFTVCGKLHKLGITEGPLQLEDSHVTSIDIRTNRCIGCIHCVRNCPTEAIRVKAGKAVIRAERCIECGMCVKVCPRHAMNPVVDTLESLKEYDYRIAIPASSFFGQFAGVRSRDHLLTALKMVGFDEIYEEAIGAEMVSHATKKDIEEGKVKLPLISSGCPSVLQLIQIKFPNLIDHVMKYRPPVEVVASYARAEAEKKYPGKKIGIFFIAPCTAKISFLKEAHETVESDVDKMVAISEVYKPVLANLRTLSDEDVEPLSKAGVIGLRWTNPGGESIALGTDKFIAVDGIEKVIDIFAKVEEEKLTDLDFVEAEACVGGCFGGSLTVENIYSAKANIKTIVDEAKEQHGSQVLNVSEREDVLLRKRTLKYKPVLQLDEDINKSLKKMEEMGRILKVLPRIDCGVCGAPTCKAFAEDIVRGLSTEDSCIILNSGTHVSGHDR